MVSSRTRVTLLALFIAATWRGDTEAARKGECIARCEGLISRCVTTARDIGFGSLPRKACKKAVVRRCLLDGTGVCDPVCDDGVHAAEEQCEGTDLGGATCESLGFASGTLVCRDTCRFDTDGCVPKPVDPDPVEVASIEALREALHTLAAGTRIRIAPGVHVVDRTIDVARDDIIIEGHGERTLLLLAAAANEPVFVLGDPTASTPSTTHRNIVLRRLRVDGSRRTQTAEISDTPGREFLRNNCVTVRRAEGVVLEDLRLEACASGGIVLEHECSNAVLRRVESFDHAFDGVAWDGNVHDSRIESSVFRNNLFAGVSFDLGPHDNVMADALVRDNGMVGIFVSDADANVFASNTIECNGQDAIFIADRSDPVRVTDSRDNEFRDNEYLDNARNGIWQAGPMSTGNRVEGGRFRGNGLMPIVENPAAPLIIGEPPVIEVSIPRPCPLRTPMP